MEPYFFVNLLQWKPGFCIRCRKGPLLASRCKEEKDRKDNVPVDVLEAAKGTSQAFYRCPDCPIQSSLCACGCGRSVHSAKKKSKKNVKKIPQNTDKHKNLNPGFALCDLLLNQCYRRISEVVSEGEISLKNNIQLEPGKVKKMLIVSVDFNDREAALSETEEDVLWVLLKRKFLHTKGEVAVCGSSQGGRRMRVTQAPMRSGNSYKTVERAAKLAVGLINVQTADIAGPSRVDVYRRMCAMEQVKETGIAMANTQEDSNWDLEELKTMLDLTGGQTKKMAAYSKKAGKKFSMTTGELAARRKARRLEFKYTKEISVQEDHEEHTLYMCRAVNVGNVVASRISILLNNNAFVEKKVGSSSFPVPGGSVLTSTQVSFFLLFS